jgi:hypothetical protein
MTIGGQRGKALLEDDGCAEIVESGRRRLQGADAGSRLARVCAPALWPQKIPGTPPVNVKSTCSLFSRGFSSDARNRRCPAEAPHRRHDCLQVVALIRREPAELDEGLDRGTGDLHNKPRGRLRKRGIAGPFAEVPGAGLPAAVATRALAKPRSPCRGRLPAPHRLSPGPWHALRHHGHDGNQRCKTPVDVRRSCVERPCTKRVRGGAGWRQSPTGSRRGIDGCPKLPHHMMQKFGTCANG